MSTTTDLLTIIKEGTSIAMVYRRADGDIQERRVDVERIWTTGSGITAFMGFCYTRKERRTFTMDRRHVLWVAQTGTVTGRETFPEMREREVWAVIDSLPLSHPPDDYRIAAHMVAEMEAQAAWLPVLQMPGLICAAVA